MKILSKPMLIKDIDKVLPNDRRILTFYNVLKHTNHNLDNFFIKANKLRFVYNYKNNAAEYNYFKNIIEYNPLMLFDLFHELFHMLTCIRLHDKIFLGFYQYNYEILESIGEGFNEAYTEILTKRYFSKYKNLLIKKDVYTVVTYLVEYIDDILGSYFLEECYFTSDLKTVVNKLNLFIEEDKTIEFFNNLDIVMYSLDVFKKYSKDDGIYAFFKIADYIYTLYIRLNEHFYKNNKIDKSTYHENNKNINRVLSEKMVLSLNNEIIKSDLKLIK